jgi:hypothetical protein
LQVTTGSHTFCGLVFLALVPHRKKPKLWCFCCFIELWPPPPKIHNTYKATVTLFMCNILA